MTMNTGRTNKAEVLGIHVESAGAAGWLNGGRVQSWELDCVTEYDWIGNRSASAACIWATNSRRAAGRAYESNAAAATSDNSDVELIRAVGVRRGRDSNSVVLCN